MSTYFYLVGQTANLTLTVDPFDETTSATVVVTRPDGTTISPTPSSADDNHTWTAQVTLNQVGVYSVVWTTAGVGMGAEAQQVEAEAAVPTDAVRQVRLLISDTNRDNRVFATSEIGDFLALNSDNVRRAAAQALDAIAANEVMVSKVIRTQDLSTDGAKVADALRKQAAELRRQADTGDGSEDAGSGFEIVEFEPYPQRYGWPY